MKRILLFFFVLVSGLTSFTQQYWPHATQFPRCNSMTTNCTKWPIVNNGDWNSASTWNNNEVPDTDDIVCIPQNITVIVAHSTYTKTTSCPATSTATAPRLQVFVCGTIQFNNSGQLYLSCNSFIQVYAGGAIRPPINGNGSSDLIQIGTSVVWGGPGSGSQPPVLGPWILSDNFTGAGVLPVALDYFKAVQKQPYAIRLEWSTVQEFNNSEFIVEQSVDQKQWKSIGSVQSAGNGTERRVYQMTDKNPAAGNNYYRLKQIDLDGRTNYSEIVRVTNNVSKNISIFPNPLSSSARIYSKEPFKAGQVLQITNATGTRIKTINAATGNSIQLDLSDYSAGLYLVQLIENGKVKENLQVVKQ